jgi:nitroreductase
MESFFARRSTKGFKPDPLSLQTISDLCWIARGFNRKELLTTPTAKNLQNMLLYVLLPDGVFLYDPQAHALEPYMKDDLRALSAEQEYAATAPMHMLFAANTALKDNPFTTADLRKYAAMNAGCMSQNIYLYCASFGLATVARGLMNRLKLVPALNLPPQTELVLAQSVGHPLE